MLMKRKSTEIILREFNIVEVTKIITVHYSKISEINRIKRHITENNYTVTGKQRD